MVKNKIRVYWTQIEKKSSYGHSLALHVQFKRISSSSSLLSSSQSNWFSKHSDIVVTVDIITSNSNHRGRVSNVVSCVRKTLKCDFYTDWNTWTWFGGTN